MAYYLRQDKKKKGTYLQMYESYWDKEKKQPRSRNIESFGYVSDLISNEIPDPVSYYQKYNVKETIDILASQKRFQFDLYDMIAQLIFAQILSPCSKSKTASTVFPSLYHGVPISEDQIYDGCAFIGESYKKYIELFNHCYEEHYKRNFNSSGCFLKMMRMSIRIIGIKTESFYFA